MTDYRSRLLDIGMWSHAALTAILAWLSLATTVSKDPFQNKLWLAFSNVASEQQWSWMFMGAAFLGAMGLVTSRRGVLIFSSFMLSTAHVIVSWFFIQSYWQGGAFGTGIGTYAIVAILGYVRCLILVVK